jgi:hypothetical protein
MIRLERDPEFWATVAAHPEVLPTLFGVDPEVMGNIAQLESVTPLAAEHGGFLFCRVDAYGFVWDLHMLFTPHGGDEIEHSAREAVNLMFETAAVIVFILEFEGNRRSKPPISLGAVLEGGGEQLFESVRENSDKSADGVAVRHQPSCDLGCRHIWARRHAGPTTP